MELLSGAGSYIVCTVCFVFFAFFRGFELPQALGLGLGLQDHGTSWRFLSSG